MEPVFLSLAELLEIHEQQIERYGGSAGLRDGSALESAVATHQATFAEEFLHTTIPAMAAAYLFHLCQNHPFIDGNKRVGANAAVAFLFMNDWDLTFSEEELVDLVLSIASSGLTKVRVVEIFESRCHPLEGGASRSSKSKYSGRRMELRIDHLSKRYPNGVQALDDVSLAIGSGMFGLLGPNGAGKSTLMRILATLQEADDGKVSLDGIDILRDKDALRRALGYLPQEFGLYPKVTALEMLDHFANLKGVASGRRSLVEALLRQTNLWDARNQRLGTFSGGMKQRFEIAQALIGNPKLIIVDEPTAGLDPEERVRFHNLLSEIGEHVIVILSTHIVSDVSDLCQSMAIINLGKVLVQGQPLELAHSLRGRIWQRLIPRAELPSYKGRLPVISSRLTAGRTLIRVYGESIPEEGFSPVDPDLEDLYFWSVTQPERAAA